MGSQSRYVCDHSPVYLDLLEDGLYAQALESGDRTRVEQLLNDLRFHVAIAILFERPIAVPEPWFTSSPAFLTVAREVLTAYKPTFEQKWATGRLWSVQFPFRLLQFDGSLCHPVQRYLRALRQRLVDQRQVLLVTPFGRIGKTLSGAEIECRADVVREIDRALIAMGLGADLPSIESLVERMGNVVARAGYEEEGVNLARDIGVLLKALAQEPLHRVHFECANMKLLESSFRAFEERIRHKIHCRGIEEFIAPELLHDYQEMFESLPGPVEGTLVAKYLRYLTTTPISDSSKEFIWSTGRFALHSAYASCCAAQSFTVSSNRYFGSKCREAVRTSFDNLIGFVGPSSEPGGFLNEGGACEIPASSYDMAGAMPWNALWREIYEIAANPAWVRSRDEIMGSIRAQRRGLSDEKYWREIFDIINDKVQTIHFGSRKGYRFVVRRRVFNEHSGDLDRIGKGAEVIVGKDSGFESGFAMGIAGLKLLVGLVSNSISGPRYFNYIRRERAVRRRMSRILAWPGKV